MLEAIARSDGTRASVLEELKASRVKDGLLGSFRFDSQRRHHARHGADPAHHRLDPAERGPAEYLEGAVVDRVQEIPRRLVR